MERNLNYHNLRQDVFMRLISIFFHDSSALILILSSRFYDLMRRIEQDNRFENHRFEQIVKSLHVFDRTHHIFKRLLTSYQNNDLETVNMKEFLIFFSQESLFFDRLSIKPSINMEDKSDIIVNLFNIWGIIIYIINTLPFYNLSTTVEINYKINKNRLDTLIIKCQNDVDSNGNIYTQKYIQKDLGFLKIYMKEVLNGEVFFEGTENMNSFSIKIQIGHEKSNMG